MSLFFFVSGYFVPTSYDRKGRHDFLKDRFHRLGIPFLIMTLIGWPLLVVLTRLVQGPSHSYKVMLTYTCSYLYSYIKKRHAHTYTYLHTVEGLSLNYIPSPGPLWFVGWLCLLSLTYAYTNDNNDDDDDDKASNNGMSVPNKAFYTPFYLVISALVLSG